MIVLLCLCMYIDLSLQMVACSFKKKKAGVLRGASLLAQMVKNLPAVQETQAQSLSPVDHLEKEMATCSSILTWKIPSIEDPSGL